MFRNCTARIEDETFTITEVVGTDGYGIHFLSAANSFIVQVFPDKQSMRDYFDRMLDEYARIGAITAWQVTKGVQG